MVSLPLYSTAPLFARLSSSNLTAFGIAATITELNNTFKKLRLFIMPLIGQGRRFRTVSEGVTFPYAANYTSP